MGYPFSRSYGVNLPSSLTRDHSSTLAYLCPATSVGLRYGRSRLPDQRFSGRSAYHPSPPKRVSHASPRVTSKETRQVARLDAASPTLRGWPLTPHAERTCSSASGNGLSTVCPSATPFGLALGPTNPPTMIVAAETSAIRWDGLLTVLLLLMPTFSLPCPPPPFPGRLRRTGDAPLPSATTRGTRIRSFGSRLEPRYIVRARSLDQ